jgi:hypothetical protein
MEEAYILRDSSCLLGLLITINHYAVPFATIYGRERQRLCDLLKQCAIKCEPSFLARSFCSLCLCGESFAYIRIPTVIIALDFCGILSLVGKEGLG